MSRSGQRLASVAADFFLDPVQRLTEQERSLMTAMLLRLVETLADEIRVRLPQDVSEHTEISPLQVIERLRASGLLSRSRLLELLLRRAEEVRYREAATLQASPLQSWASDEVPAIASAAMAVILGRAASSDRFGKAGLEIGDCDAETAVALTYAVAAVLASQASKAEELAVAAAVDLLGRHDEGQSLHALEARLVLALEAAGLLTGALAAQLANSGELNLLAETLGRMGGVPATAVRNLLVPPSPGSTALLLRMADLKRDEAASLLASLGTAFGALQLDEALAEFERLSAEEVAQQRAFLRYPPDFAAAVDALSHHG